MSGYIQKKIVNAINDLKTRHDGSTRDANNGIFQFAYGGDGFNAKELIPCGGISFPFFVNPVFVASTLNSEAEKLLEEDGVDIGQLRVLNKDETNLLISFIEYLSVGQKTEVSERITFNVRTVLRFVIKDVKIYEYMIPHFCRKIKDEFEETRVKNGFMAGLTAASSIGEPTTQMSSSKEEKIPMVIKYLKSGKIQHLNEQIGDLVDSILENACDIKFHLGVDSVAGIPCKDIEIYVHTVDPATSKTAWKPVCEVSRHPASGGMVKIHTKSGRIITTTLSHSHLKRSEDGTIIPIRGDELQIGDFVPVCSKLDLIENIKEFSTEGKTYPLNFITGWLFGAYLSEGSVNNGRIGITNITSEFEKRCFEFTKQFGGAVKKNQYWHSINESEKQYESVTNYISGCPGFARYLVEVCGSGSANKHVPAFALFAPDDFVKGLIRGYFDGDGNVNADRQLVRFHSISRDLIETMALLLNRYGIFGTIGIEKKNSPNPLYSYCLLRKHASIYLEQIGSDHPDKIEALESIVAYNNREDVHSRREDIDVIPGVGKNISMAAKPLKLEGYSRNYKRYEKKAFVGRETLKKYLELFESNGASGKDYEILKTAAESDIIWDQIETLEILSDPEELVYDLGVSGNHTFMLQCGIFTHNTLNTFHNAGNSAKDVTLGVPRLKELINATKNPSKPTCTVYLDEPSLGVKLEKRVQMQTELKEAETLKLEKQVEEIKKQIAELDHESLYEITDFSAPLTHLTVDYFLKNHELRYLSVEDAQPESSPLGLLTYEEYSPEWWVTLSEGLGSAPRFEPQTWVIILHLDIDKLYRYGVTVETVATKIEENGFGTRGYAMSCVPSPDVIGQIEVYLNFTEIGEYARSEIKMPLGEKITRHLITPENVEYFVARDVAMDIIRKTDVQGIPGIKKTYVRQESKTGEWIVDTQGTNLVKLLGMPGIDPTRTLSDDMWEIYNVLGVEATRKFLFREANKILSFDGVYINPRHIYLLVDAMTRSGTITSVNRDGIPRDVGPIAKGMFEKAVDNFGEAAAFAEHDKMKGMAAAVMFGTLAEAGSGTVEIKDAEKLPAKRKPLEIPLKPGTKKTNK